MPNSLRVKSKFVTYFQHVLMFYTLFCALLCGFQSLASDVDRTEFVKAAYSATKHLVPILKDSEEIKDQPTLGFLTAIDNLFSKSSPDLIFVRGQDQFIIEEGEKPRLMRSHPDPNGPIFINEELLNSHGLKLNFIQMVKLILHELGHKTDFGSIGERDRWAQNIETLLEPFYVTSNKDDDGPFVEAISISPALVQIPIEEDPFRLQPSFWLVVHHPDKTEELTNRVKDFLNKNTILNRTIGTEIQTATAEVANLFAAVIKKKFAPIFDQLAASFSEPGRPSDINFQGSLKGIEGRIQSLSILEIVRISSARSGVSLESNQVFARCHTRKHQMNATGFPFKDLERFPIQIRISDSSIQTQLVTEPNFNKVAKVERVIREGGVLKSMEVSFSDTTYPFAVDLGLQHPQGQFRLRAREKNQRAQGEYLVKFDFEPGSDKGVEFTDRIIVDDEKTYFLNRSVDVSEVRPSIIALTYEDVLRDSIGVWGKQGSQDVLKKEFSHLKRSMLFFLNTPDPKFFVINPYNLWIEFEVKSEIEILQAELFWSREMMIFNTAEENKSVFDITEVDENGRKVNQRYTGGGKLLEQGTFREAILFENGEGVRIYPSQRAGYKVIRMKAITPIKHLRELRSENEAHSMPAITPTGIRILTKDLRTLTHSFPSEFSEEVLRGELRRGCDEFLKSMD